ncbi:hypothetical protein EXS54_01390 [Patescibacteria group bacterium]|nr:hypothetical protein [Patescibacteria group bacterium]
MIANVFQGVFDTGYDIEFRNRLPRFGTTHQANGYIDPATDRIIIRRDAAIDQRAITLLHEIVHEIYPDWSEADVEATAQYTYQNLSDEDRGIVNFLATDPEETRLPA